MRSNNATAVNMRKASCGRCGAEYDLLNTIWIGNRRRCRNCETRRGGAVVDLGRAA